LFIKNISFKRKKEEEMEKFRYENCGTRSLPCGGKIAWECGRVTAISNPNLGEKEKVLFQEIVGTFLPRGWAKDSPEVITLQNDRLLIIGDAV